MELNQVLESRRSIRKYKKASIEKKVIEEIIEAAIQAPSWKNSQTARYHIVMNEPMLQKVKEEVLPEFNYNNAKEASCIIVCTFIKDRSGFNKDGTPTNECGQGWGYYDCGLHNENMILKARDLGLDTLIMGIRDEAKIRELLDVGENEIIVSVISLGYRDIDPAKPPRKTVEDITKFY